MPFRHSTRSSGTPRTRVQAALSLIACVLILAGGALRAETGVTPGPELAATHAVPADVAASPATIDMPGLTLSSPAALIGTFLRLVAALAFVLVVFWVCARLMRRLDTLGRGREQQALRVIATLPLGQRERVLVVQAGDEQILLGVTAQRIERLHVLATPLPTNVVANPATGKAVGTRAGSASGPMLSTRASAVGDDASKVDVTSVRGEGDEFRSRLMAALQRRSTVT